MKLRRKSNNEVFGTLQSINNKRYAVVKTDTPDDITGEKLSYVQSVVLNDPINDDWGLID